MGNEDPQFRIADAKVAEATGRTRQQWFELLDAAGATGMAHGDIARLLVDEHGVDGWWAQTVTVDYEHARRLRGRFEQSGGYTASKSKTVGAPASAVHRAWLDEGARAGWLDGDLEITSVKPETSVRGRWDGGPSRVAVWLTAKGPDRTQVQVSHEKLADAEAVEEAKAAWGKRLERLASYLRDAARS